MQAQRKEGKNKRDSSFTLSFFFLSFSFLSNEIGDSCSPSFLEKGDLLLVVVVAGEAGRGDTAWGFLT